MVYGDADACGPSPPCRSQLCISDDTTHRCLHGAPACRAAPSLFRLLSYVTAEVVEAADRLEDVLGEVRATGAGAPVRPVGIYVHR